MAVEPTTPEMPPQPSQPSLPEAPPPGVSPPGEDIDIPSPGIGNQPSIAPAQPVD